ncbi:UDP-N-acetylmuramoyl-L-alanine--D-glutamate ligase [Longibacter salinarum]|uniref:UDP-N-acetylmuramoylalanine--D-glutamate ligase n=1 Tax=Longibacter salinarum TaxID=1850348 RepID=A0A2A8CXF8_9BACT|nr:UDP-N-acetylmuramoyl-L-alanine--D-glutamate ligase [Longibacter salinarum]PEN13257.1 UDP-N-acetylmuramoyl-L-alanine--D-glutamate ligase [Longibacter salinarum]
MTPDSLSDRSVTVVGGARSGRAVARLLAQAGASVFVTEHGPPRKGIEETLDGLGVAYEFGGHTSRAIDADFVVVSPGVPTEANILRQCRRAGLPIYSEIEVASWFCRAPIIAITGTNGKTTTTSLTGHVIRCALDESDDRNTIVAGNIGYPFSDYVRDAREQDVVVLEVSSFQLDHVDAFRPRVSVLLNITPDHLDRYDDDFNAYAQSKFRIFGRQEAGDAVVYNADDELVCDYVRSRAAEPGAFTAYGISIDGPVERGAFVSDGTIVIRSDNDEETLMPASDLALRGPHNLYNSLAAAMSAHIMGAGDAQIREGLSTFEGVPHRLENVATVDDVLYVNDSKATNVNAVWYALESFDQPIVLIAGGRDKGNDYEALKPLIRERVRGVVALGESASKVMEELGSAAGCASRASTMEDALQKARSMAQPGDVVLLSPACSSFDMYENYEERGDTFRRLVRNL